MVGKVLTVFLVFSLGVNVILLSEHFAEAPITGQAVADPPFSLYTEAVCTEGVESIECHDEVFIQCGETTTKLGNVLGNNPEFELDWEDPRT